MSTHHDSHHDAVSPPSAHGTDSPPGGNTSITNNEPAKVFPPIVKALFAVFSHSDHRSRENSKYQVSRTVSLLAAVYEKARNAVEFRADHLIRRAAIERILKRRLVLGGPTNTLAENLVVELLWARYLDSSQVNDDIVAQVQQTIDKYLVVKQVVFNHKLQAHGISWDLLQGILAAEIEEQLVNPEKRQALVNFYYQAILPSISLPNESEVRRNMLAYIAVEKSFAQADEPVIYLHLIKIVQSDWLTAKPTEVGEQIQLYLKNLQEIQTLLKHPLLPRLSRYVRRHNPPFLLLRDVLFNSSNSIEETAKNERAFDQLLTETATKRYQEIGAKVRRAVIRSIIYLFLTKMVFALALEAPVDLLITKRIDYVALAINSFFPPILLFLIAGFIRVPGKDNTVRLVNRVKQLVYEFDVAKSSDDRFVAQQTDRKPVLTAVFTMLYLVAFLLSFGLITLVLNRLHFNIASQAIFMFFVTLVSFFAYRIRQSAKEYEIVERTGILSPLIDFFFLPILQVGSFLSGEIAKLNVIMFVFDFILEAPLKVILEFMEEWFRFIRTKKDEIV